MRLFVGLVPSAESLVRIEGICPMLLPAGSRRVPAAQLHLTLAFTPNYPESEITTLKKRLQEEVFHGVQAFYLTPYSLHWQKGTLWLAFQEDPRLEALAQQLHQVLGVRFRPPFRPHVTLARIRSEYPLPLGSYPLRMEPPQLLFPEAYLFRSHLSPAGAQYERLMRYTLCMGSNLPL